MRPRRLRASSAPHAFGGAIGRGSRSGAAEGRARLNTFRPLTFTVTLTAHKDRNEAGAIAGDAARDAVRAVSSLTPPDKTYEVAAAWETTALSPLVSVSAASYIRAGASPTTVGSALRSAGVRCSAGEGKDVKDGTGTDGGSESTASLDEVAKSDDASSDGGSTEDKEL